MSQKVTSKNLSYSSSLPPFLAALRAQASGASGPDSLAASQRRSAKKRSSSEEAEDAPLVVDERGNTVTVEVDEDGAVKEAAARSRDDDSGPPGANSAEKAGGKEAEAKSAIGGRKRKVGRVVGDAADEVALKDAAHSVTKDGKEPSATAQKVKKKAKKIKLSFDQDEG